ncbi:MAG: hypothetical protein ACREA8_11055 [Nitrosotalea sp.]
MISIPYTGIQMIGIPIVIYQQVKYYTMITSKTRKVIKISYIVASHARIP